MGSGPIAFTWSLDINPVSSKEFHDIKVILEFIFTLNVYVTW